MRFILAAGLALLLAGCVVRDEVPIKTEVITYPEGALVQFNGLPVGRAPASVILPQDTNGKLVERTVLRAIPNTEQQTLVTQTRILEPGNRTDRVPHRILIDLSKPGTDQSSSNHVTTVTKTANEPRTSPRTQTERSKPTRAVGIDRWNPGIY